MSEHYLAGAMDPEEAREYAERVKGAVDVLEESCVKCRVTLYVDDGQMEALRPLFTESIDMLRLDGTVVVESARRSGDSWIHFRLVTREGDLTFRP